jgi:hypothetical protein
MISELRPSFSTSSLISNRSRGCCRSKAATIFPPYKSGIETTGTDSVTLNCFSAFSTRSWSVLSKTVPLMIGLASIFI